MSDHPFSVLALFQALSATPRPAGSEAERVARARCIAALTEGGFQCTERPFSYSAWPGRWSVPCVGALLMVAGGIAMLGAWRGAATDAPAGVLPRALALSVLVLLIALLGHALVSRFGTVVLQWFPWFRASAVNVEAVRDPHTRPNVWLVAHLDSKSQPVPMLLRVAAVVVCTVAWLGLGICVGLQALTPVVLPDAVFGGLAAVATVGAIPLLFCTVGANSAGALDNASGVAAVVAAARALDPALPVGVLLTSAEELTLAGARAWVRQYDEKGSHPSTSRRHHIAINCDSIDDTGRLVCLAFGGAGRLIRRIVARGAAHVEKTVGVAPDVPLLRRGLPGVLVDAVALTDAGWTAITVTRGHWRTLRRIHTRRDDVRHMTGRGIPEAAQLIESLAAAAVEVVTPPGTGEWMEEE